MDLPHINVTTPKHSETIAGLFYTGQLGLRELQRPEGVDLRGGVWFDAGGLSLRLSGEERHMRVDTRRHFGIGCGNVDGLKARLKAAGVEIEDGPPVPWKRFFIGDPFGNRVEIHAPGELRTFEGGSCGTASASDHRKTFSARMSGHRAGEGRMSFPCGMSCSSRNF